MNFFSGDFKKVIMFGMILFVASFVFPLPRLSNNGDWSIDKFDVKSGNKLVKDWNTIRVRKGIQSDSIYMEDWVPHETQLCIAITDNNICYAIAHVKEESNKEEKMQKYIMGICTSPGESNLGSILMEQLILNNYTMNTEMKQCQPRWLIAQLFWK